MLDSTIPTLPESVRYSASKEVILIGAGRSTSGASRQLRGAGETNNNTVIYSNTTGVEWRIVDNHQSSPIDSDDTGVTGSTKAFCRDFENGGIAYFNCSTCSSPPFQLNETSGFGYWASLLTPVASGSGLYPNYTLPGDKALQLILLGANAQSLCNMTFGKNFNQTNGLVQSSSLLQNFPSNLHQSDCRSKLSQAYGVGLQALQDDVQVCIDDLQLLPSYVNLSAPSASASAKPGYPNCWRDDPFPTTTDGTYVEPPLSVLQENNITSAAPAFTYVVTPHIDFPFRNWIVATGSPLQCSIVRTPESANISSLAAGLFDNQCCYNASAFLDGGDHALQALLADMCNTMISPLGEQCIGVTVAPMDSGPLSGLACFKTGFKAGVSGNTIDVSNTGETCISPGGLLYLRNSANPAWQDVPGFINTTHIYTDGPEMGWTFYSSNASTVATASTIFMESSTISITAEQNTVILEQVQGKGVNNTTALCVTTNHTQAEIRFTCQNCPAPGFQIFLPNTTAGFKMWLSQELFGAPGASDSFQLRLADPLGHVLCDLNHTVMDVGPNNGLRQLGALYQNAPECIFNSSWSDAASLMITTDRSVDKFYVDELVMLPRAVAGTTPGDVIASNISNCDGFPQPEPTDEDAHFTFDSASQPWAAKYVTQLGLSYDLHQNIAFVETQYELYKLQPNAGKCSTSKVAHAKALANCSIPGHACCVRYSDIITDADGSKNSSLPQILGDMCDRMWLPSKGSQDEAVCQGFAYDTQHETFTFFGQLQAKTIDLTDETTCNRPTSLLWILNAALTANGTETKVYDTRKNPSKSGPSLGVVFGGITGIAGPVAATLTWLALTYSYRMIKLSVVTQVQKYLKVEDISGSDITDSDHSLAVSHTQSGAIQMATYASDSVGTRAGIWRAKFEGVRCAVLLLAFNRLNRNLQARSTPNQGGSGTCFIVRSFLTSVLEAHYSGMSHEKFLSV
ncbi:hypothetical protein WJX82_000670 [Trebouxia sp. C0006]